MLWLLLEAEFLAIVLVLVYVGAVMVLFLFVVMMLDINVETLRTRLARATRRWRSVVALLMVVETRPGDLVAAAECAVDGTRVRADAGRATATPKALGAVLYTEYVYAFELAAVHPAAGHRCGDHADHAQADRV